MIGELQTLPILPLAEPRHAQQMHSSQTEKCQWPKSLPEREVDEAEAPVLASVPVVCNVDPRDRPEGREELLQSDKIELHGNKPA